MGSNAMGKAAIPRRVIPYLPDIRFAGIGHKILEMFPHDGVKDLVKLSDILWTRSTEILTQKREALEKGDESVAAQVGEGKDIMSILCTCVRSLVPMLCTDHRYITVKANMEASGDDKLSEEELIGQMRYYHLCLQIIACVYIGSRRMFYSQYLDPGGDGHDVERSRPHLDPSRRTSRYTAEAARGADRR